MRPQLICFIVLGILVGNTLCWWFPWDILPKGMPNSEDVDSAFCDKLNDPQLTKQEKTSAYDKYFGVCRNNDIMCYPMYRRMDRMMEEESDCAYNTYVPKTSKNCPSSHPIGHIDEERCYSECPEPFFERKSKCTCATAKCYKPYIEHNGKSKVGDTETGTGVSKQ